MSEIYQDGTYLANNPTWHEEDSAWKAGQITKILKQNNLQPGEIAEIGCGSGEILHQLSLKYEHKAQFYGFDISKSAFEICSKKSSEKLSFHHGNLLENEDEYFDLVMAIDVFEHVEDYLGFLQKLRTKAQYKLFHIPLDLSVQSVFRSAPIIKARKTIGHLHYFTKETALETLRDTGYEIIDYFYTAGGLELPNRGWKANLMKAPRRLAFTLHQDLAVRVLGGYSLMVLTK